MVAFRYLRARRQEGFVSVIAIFSLLGIALGVATLIIVMSVMNGFRADLLGRILGLNGDLGVYAAAGPLGDFAAAAQKVKQIPGVTAAIPIVEGQVMATTDQGASGALVRGIRPADLKSLRLVSERIIAGSLADFSDDGIAIGYRLAQRLGLGVGGRVTVISPQGTATAFGTMPRLKTYHVVALFDVGMYEYDNSFIYASFDAAQLFFRVPDAASYLQVFVADPDRVGAQTRAIDAAFAGRVRIVRLATGQFEPVQRGRDRAQRDVSDPDLDHRRRRVQHHLRHDHDGEGQGPRHRDTAHDGRLARHDPANFYAARRLHRRGRDLRRLHPRRRFHRQYRGDPRVYSEHRDLFSAEIHFFTRIPARIDQAEVATVVIMALACRFSPRSIRPGERRGSIRSRRCATSDAGCAASRCAGASRRARGRSSA